MDAKPTFDGDMFKQLALSIVEQQAVDVINRSGMSDFEKGLIAGLVTHKETTVKINDNSSLTINCDKPGLKFNFSCEF